MTSLQYYCVHAFFLNIIYIFQFNKMQVFVWFNVIAFFMNLKV